MHNRRTFIKAAGLASSIPAMVATTNHADAKPPMDESRLQGRNAGRSTVVAQHGMVCTSQPLASLAGIEILKAGGNCVDAAIAANAMLGVTEAASCGIGGDLFAILWSEKDQRLFGLNASGRAPHAWNLDKASRLGLKSIPPHSPLSWTVPGCVSGWAMLNERFGKRTLAECLADAIDYAAEGFPLSPIIAKSMRRWTDKDAKHLADVFHPNGQIPGYGDVFKNPRLASSYRSIAKDGADAFYKGPIAEAIVDKSKELGGYITMGDLADHVADWVDPVSSNYRGYDVWEIPPNGQGIAALQMLNILENFDIGELKPNSVEHLHLVAEAKKLAFEDRAKYYADPEFANVPTDWLISKAYAKKRAQRISLDKASTEVGHGDPQLGSDTTYLTAADREGNMISLIQSNYSSFGSWICPDGVGFPIQNRGRAFSLDPAHRNALAPNKRPFHTIIPAFMTKAGQPVMSFGVMGGDFQPQGHSQIVMNIVDFGMSVQQAGEQPRLGHLGSSSPWGGTVADGGVLTFERGIDDSVRLRLAERGHRVKPGASVLGGYQAIWREPKPTVYFGASDPRKDGSAIAW